MQCAVRIARCLGGGFGMQPRPRIVGGDAFGETHGAGDLAGRHLVVFREHLPHEIRHVAMPRAHVMERHAHIELEAALFDGGGDVPADLDVLLLAGTIRVDAVGSGIERLRRVGTGRGVGDVPVAGIGRVPCAVGYAGWQLWIGLRIFLACGCVGHGDVGDVRQILVAQFERQIQLFPRLGVTVAVLATLQLVVQMLCESNVAVALEPCIEVDGAVAQVRLVAGYDEYRKDDGNHRHQRTERGD